MNRPDPPPRAELASLALAAVAAVATDGHPDAADWQIAMLPECVRALREDPAPADAALVRAADTLALTDAELLTAALCLAVERDPLAPTALALAQPESGSPRPLVALAVRAAAPLGGSIDDVAFGKAVASGLLTLGDDDRPLPLRTLAMPLPLVAAACGREGDWDGVRRLDPAAIALPDAVLAEARRRAALLAAGQARGLVIRSPSRREAAAAAALVATALGAGLAEIEAEPPAGLAPWLALTRRLPVFAAKAGPGDSWRAPRLAHHPGPWIALAGLDGGVAGEGPREEWVLPMPDTAERARLWRRAGWPAGEARRAAQGFRHGAGRIAEVAEAARLAAQRRGARRPGWEDLAAGIATGDGALDKLARRSVAHVADDALILPGEQRDGLSRLVERARVRCLLGDTLGPAVRARYRPGVRALLVGESGTGKTLAAHWLAERLGLPLYRVDMAALTSKWIGETEKNLSAVLAAAEHADALLFFDEADALFGGRTEVGNANDRYANAQTNYLLQRIEDFDGIVVLASNSRERFDPAFARRLDAILTFPMPDAAARRALWDAHLGAAHRLDPGLLDRLAVAVDLAGGHIRNIVLAAAARALAAGRALEPPDLSEAIAAEYAKLGRAQPAFAP